ncbi:hypothetical protein WH52_05485 [Tenacibaculum holothuriorum]|uniref:Nudix hydrolase domain-containing protein n=1 Tax=Tenacibaculum holothuriorum TaxID=1635173 RepID=A0A1Y2PCP0_9FLAO|nr:hypothetical protein [Tenacibaculum holothuriorum]OSY88233.1 hypothetical protein WH52_05485 [Tenacibaculum holothuriorum]
MKKILIFIALFFVAKLFAQETGNDSYTIQRLIIFNNKGEVLLQKHANGWMTPALRHNTETSTKKGLFNLASNFGLKVSNPQLQGVFMYFHSDHKKPSFRQHYSCDLKGGKIKIPKGALDVQWFSKDEAIEKMLLPEAKIVTAVGEMTKHILNYPTIIWGGSYLLVKEKGKKTKSEVIENFYPIGRIE